MPYPCGAPRIGALRKLKIRGTPATDDQTRPNRYYINLSLYYATLVAVPHPEKGTIKAETAKTCAHRFYLTQYANGNLQSTPLST